jgi:septal ring factor EnvC (AmiA/AmiB activator)
MKVTTSTQVPEGKKRIGRPPKVRVNGEGDSSKAKRTTILLSTLAQMRAAIGEVESLRLTVERLRQQSAAQNDKISELLNEIEQQHGELEQAREWQARLQENEADDQAASWALQAVPDLMEIIGTLHLGLLRAQRQK